MYAAFYHLRDLPFQLGPDPRFFFDSSVHAKAMAYLAYGLDQGEGFIVITGEIGAGKSTIVEKLCDTLDPARYAAGRIVTSQLDAEDVLRAAALAFGIDSDGLDKATLLHRFQETLAANHTAGRRNLLIVDEAQNLTVRALEELRMLSNFQGANLQGVDGEPGQRTLLQTFLLGQPQFRETLARPDLEQLRQRIIASYHLGPLGAAETRGYIEHRLSRVGWEGDPSFTPDAYAAIHRRTGGVPRRINTLCSRLLLYGCLEESHAIDATVVEQVAEELACELPAAQPEKAPLPAAAMDRAPLSATYGLDDLSERLQELEHQVRARDAVAPPGTANATVNALSIDVEDWYQVQALAGRIRRGEWAYQESRVERNTDTVLRLLDEQGVKATFFTLGWVAERHKALVRRIVAQGHELASHGYAHYRADEQTPDTFREDVSRTKKLLEDVGGVAVRGYRAACFSIGQGNLWASEVLAEAGYVYSSSIYPIRHDIYGMPGAPRTPFRPRGRDGVIEIPIATVRLFGKNRPCGGGGYFRLLPYGWSRWAIRRVNKRERAPCVFYFHPWEIDPGQPRPDGLPLRSRLRHYTNLGRMENRLRRLCDDFPWDRIDRVFQSQLSETP